MSRLPFQTGPDGFCGISTALNRHLRDARQRLALLIKRKRQVAGDKNIRIVGNAQIGIDLDAANLVGLGRACAYLTACQTS